MFKFKKAVAVIALMGIVFSTVMFPVQTASAQSASISSTLTDIGTNLATYFGFTQTAATGVTAAATAATTASVPSAALSVPTYDPAIIAANAAIESAKAQASASDKRSLELKNSKTKIIEVMFEVALQTMKKKLLDMVVDKIVVWIQGGGSPNFVTDWKSMLKKAGDEAFSAAIMQSDAAQLCSPFKLQLKVALLPVNKFYKDEVKCTLTDVVSNVKGFYSDFSKGGWIAYGQAWEPQNNFAMQLLIADDEVAVQTQLGKTAKTNEAVAGKGFLSMKKCALGAEDANLYNSCMASASAGGPPPASAASSCKQQACTKWDIVTPGSFAGDMISKSASAKYFDQIIGAKDLAQYAAAIIDAGLNRLMSEGMSMLSSSGNTDTPSTYTQPLQDALTSVQQNQKNDTVAAYKVVLDERSAVLASKTDALTSMQQTLTIYNTLNDKNCVPAVPAQTVTDLQAAIASSTQEVAVLQNQVSVITTQFNTAKSANPERIKDMDQLTQDYEGFVNNNAVLIGYSSNTATRDAASAEAVTKANALISAQNRLTTCTQTQG